MYFSTQFSIILAHVDHPKDNLKKSRRVSSDGAALRWSNGWTPLTALSDNVHGKLFGDVLVSLTTTERYYKGNGKY